MREGTCQQSLVMTLMETRLHYNFEWPVQWRYICMKMTLVAMDQGVMVMLQTWRTGHMEDWANAGCEGYLANPNMLRMGWGVDDISFLLMCECVDVSLVMQLGCLDPHMHAHVVAYTPRGWNSSCP